MAVTRHEDIIAALVGLCEGNVVASVQRELVLPTVCPDQGLANFRPADLVEQDRHLGTGVIEWLRVVSIEIAVQAATGPLRVAAFEEILCAIGLLLDGETLGGKVDYINLGVPEDADELAFEGTAAVRAAVLPLELYYTTSSNPLEVST